jgi:hypothetical protein
VDCKPTGRAESLPISTKSREFIWDGRIIGSDICAKGTRQVAQQVVREADRAEAETWSVWMEGYGGPTRPAPTVAQCLNGGLGWLEV